ncbi:MAG: amidohydrolase, partial [Bacteroidota bacterium]
MYRTLLLFSFLILSGSGWSQTAGPQAARLSAVLPAEASAKLHNQIDELASKYEDQVIQWRRHYHENPELSNREFKTGEHIADLLEEMGLEVTRKVAKTGVKAVLRTGRPGPVIALRADIDALPVVERVDIPFASKVKTTYLGRDVGVMHACGHDTHIAMLLGAAKILTDVKDQLNGTIVFMFQPAEEGAPPGEEGGAALMIKEGILDDPKVDVAFGLHINSGTEVGTIRYKPGGAMAAADRFVITVKGKQSHGSRPWSGIDPIVVSAQIVN